MALPLEKAAKQIAERLGIGSIILEAVTDLSVGQQQRVAAARALLGSPELMIADEPTSALDEDQRENFLDLLFTHCREIGSTLIFVSHDRRMMPLFDRALSLPGAKRGIAHGSSFARLPVAKKSQADVDSNFAFAGLEREPLGRHRAYHEAARAKAFPIPSARRTSSSALAAVRFSCSFTRCFTWALPRPT